MSKKKEEKDAPIATEKNIVKAETTGKRTCSPFY